MKNVCLYPIHSEPSDFEEYISWEQLKNRDCTLPDIWLSETCDEKHRRELLLLLGKISIIEIPYGDRLENHHYYTMALRYARGTSALLIAVMFNLMRDDIQKMPAGSEKRRRWFSLLQEEQAYYKAFNTSHRKAAAGTATKT